MNAKRIISVLKWADAFFCILAVEAVIVFCPIRSEWGIEFWETQRATFIGLTAYAFGYVLFLSTELMLLSRLFKEEGPEDGEGWPMGFMLAVFFALGWPIFGLMLLCEYLSWRKLPQKDRTYHTLVDGFSRKALGI